MPYLLDTNTCIHAMRGAPSVVAAMAAVPPSEIAISTITCYELHVGSEKCANPQRERAKVDALVGQLRQINFDLTTATLAARIRVELESRGEMIGPYDVLIAGHALALGLTLVTSNLYEFMRVPGLAIVNWHQ